jgi:AcrR family transcriptional regulator
MSRADIEASKAAASAAGAAPATSGTAAGRGDTRARIQQVALELFAEQGYEKTSLREIAERLEVTKAALYYHFKSKEDIVRSLIDDYFGQIDDLIAWGRLQPRTSATRRGILRRYIAIVADGTQVFRMLQQNQAAMNSLEHAKQRGDVFRQRIGGLVEVLAGADASPAAKVRAAMALGAVSVGWMFCADFSIDRAELRQTILEAVCELIPATSG